MNTKEIERKEKRITVSFTPSEYKKISDLANQNHQSMAAYIRSKTLSNTETSVTPKDYAKVCNHMQFMAEKYQAVEGFSQDINTLNRLIQHRIFGGNQSWR
ncbi:MAG: hypothetical protein SO170_02975 [Butyribacter sp.]|nr:hypothetical protein [bacterium]MDY3853916.1 hypothetical protein [Butyribacter sp.]